MRLAELLKDLAAGKVLIDVDYQILYRIENNILQGMHEMDDAQEWFPTTFYDNDDWENDSWEIYKEKTKVKRHLMVYKQKDGTHNVRLWNADGYPVSGDIVYSQEIEWEE